MVAVIIIVALIIIVIEQCMAQGNRGILALFFVARSDQLTVLVIQERYVVRIGKGSLDEFNGSPDVKERRIGCENVKIVG
jgi:hypothetical protein